MIKKKTTLLIICLVAMISIYGCGTTRSLVSNTSATMVTSSPIYNKLVVGRNIANTADQIRCMPATTLAVEPNSIIKVYDDLGVIQVYSTTADSMGCFTLDIGNSLRPQVNVTATAPFKSESDQVGLINPN